jgi:hypothetical protein
VRPGIRVRFWAEAGLAFLCCFLAVLTVFSHDWIETIFGVDPDHGSGSVEWLVVAGLLVAGVLVSAAARVEWRRPRGADLIRT